MLKVAYTSDLHVDITTNNQTLCRYIFEYVKRLQPDVFVMAGDLANSLTSLADTLKLFSELPCLKVMVPGNHDLWIESNHAVKKGRDSFYKYYQAIPKLCVEYDFVYPIRQPYYIKDVVIVGTVGWYDYTLRDPRLDYKYHLKDYEVGKFDEGIWNDTRYAVWLRNPKASDWRARQQRFSNLEVFEIFFAEFKRQLILIPDTSNKVLAIMHTAPFQACLVVKESASPFDAYEGSSRLGELLSSLAEEKQVVIVCGHRHQKLEKIIGKLKLYRSPVGYLKRIESNYEVIAEAVVGQFEL